MFSSPIAAAIFLGFQIISPSYAIPTLSSVGAKFFDSNGAQFFLKGVAYQFTDGADPLANKAQCKLDALSMKALGVNSIRVYHIDPSLDHDGCMAAFSDAGIYAFVDLDNAVKGGLVDQTHIEPLQPALSQFQVDSYNKALDAIAKYDNLGGVFIGNEIMTLANESLVAPYVKAAAVAVKKYRDGKSLRKIPVGYSAADVSGLRPMLQNYMACDSNQDNNLDFFGLNAYEWCGGSSYHTSGYDMLQANASGYSIPLFFSEVGCNTVPPRTFADQAAIFGPEMSPTWSGAIIYEWVETQNHYGLVSYASVDPAEAATGTPLYGSPTPILPDYSNLLAQWKTVSPSSVSLAEYQKSTAAITPLACPTSTADGWLVAGNVPLPTVGQSGAVTSTSASASATGKTGGAMAVRAGEGTGLGVAFLTALMGLCGWL